jgi:hypothetical protein
MSECKFCEALRSWQQFKSMEPGSKQEYTVAIVIRSWRPPDIPKYRASQITDLRPGGHGYKLRFCPACGRDLQKKQNPKGCKLAHGEICFHWDGFECNRSAVAHEGDEQCPCD